MDHPYKKPKFTLEDAHVHSMLLVIKCQLCKITHRYLPGDLLPHVGAIPLWDIAAHFRCERCGKKEFMKADWQNPIGDLKQIRVRRLVRVRRVRVFDWEEGPL